MEYEKILKFQDLFLQNIPCFLLFCFLKKK